MKNILFLCSLIFTLVSCSDPKSELLKCDKPWENRTEFEKIIGAWCSDKYQPGVGRTIVSKTMAFQTKICFYSDHTMKEFQVTNSYIDMEDEMDSGTEVDVKDGKLFYKSKNYGERSCEINIDETTLTTNGFTVLSGSGTFTKCN